MNNLNYKRNKKKIMVQTSNTLDVTLVRSSSLNKPFISFPVLYVQTPDYIGSVYNNVQCFIVTLT